MVDTASSPPGGTRFDTRAANQIALSRLTGAEPRLVDVRPAGEVVPGITPNLILTSGAPLPLERVRRRAARGDHRRRAVRGSRRDARRRRREARAGEIRVAPCHAHGCVGSVAGVYTASMPVFVVENRPFGNTGSATSTRARSRAALNYGCYDDGVPTSALVHEQVAPVVGDAVRRRGRHRAGADHAARGQMGDELHSRNAAATMLFERELLLPLLDIAGRGPGRRRARWTTASATTTTSCGCRWPPPRRSPTPRTASRRRTVVTAHGVRLPQGFAIRVSGLGDTWFLGPHAVARAKLFEGHTEDEITWMGGERSSRRLSAWAASHRPRRLPCSATRAARRRRCSTATSMYDIVVGEHTEYKIPLFDYRGTPTGIDIQKVVATGVCRPWTSASAGGRRPDRRRLHPRPDRVLQCRRRGVRRPVPLRCGSRRRTGIARGAGAATRHM